MRSRIATYILAIWSLCFVWVNGYSQCIDDHVVEFLNGSMEDMVVCDFEGKKVGITPGAIGHYLFIITDKNDIILDYQGTSWLVLEGLPFQDLKIYGISFWGELGDFIGQNVFEAEFTDFCFTLSQNFICIDAFQPEINLPDTIVLCEGSSIQLNPLGNENYVYNWQPPTFLDDPTAANPIASPETDITYSVTINDANGMCETVTDEITLLVQPSDVRLGFDLTKDCASLTVNFTNTSTNADNFIWNFGDPSKPDFRSTEENPTYTYTEPGTYVVELQSDDAQNACLASSAMRIVVAGDDFQDFEQTTELCAPNDVVLDPGLNPDYIYQWDPNPLFADLNSPTQLVRLSQSDTFGLTVIDPLNQECTIRGTIIVIVGDDITFNDDSIALCPDDDRDIFLNPDGNPNYTYTWSPAELLDNPNAVNPQAIGLTETTTFEARVFNPEENCEGVFSKFVLVLGDDFVDFRRDTSLCAPNYVFLNPDGNPKLIYSWEPAENIENPTAANPRAYVSETTIFTATVSAPYGADCGTITGSITVEVDSTNILFDDTAIELCASTSVELNPGGNPNYTYQWTPADLVSDPNAVNPTATVTEDIVFEVTITNEDASCTGVFRKPVNFFQPGDLEEDTLQVCSGSSIFLNPNFEEGLTYEWSPETFLNDPNIPNPIVSPEEDITYTVTITDPDNADCQFMQMIHVEVVESNTVVDFSAFKDCGSLTVEFTNESTNADSLVWNFGDPDNRDFRSSEENPSYTYSMGGDYLVELRSLTDVCVAGIVKTITVTGEDFVDFTIDTNLCAPNFLDLNPNGNPSWIYNWDQDGDLSDANSHNPTVYVDGDRTFTVVVTDPLNDSCTIMGTVNVTVDTTNINFDDSDIMACPNAVVELNPNGDVNNTYSWEPADLVNDPTAVNPTVRLLDDTVLTVTVTTADGLCTGVFMKRVNLFETDFIMDFLIEKTCGSTVVTFTNTSQNVDGIEWRLGDENGEILGTEDMLEYDFGAFGSFEITLVAPAEDTCGSLTLPVDLLDPDNPLPVDTIFACGDEQVFLNPGGGTTFEYEWSPANLVSNPNSINPRALIEESTLFTVVVTDPSIPNCSFTDSVLVLLNSDIDISFNNDTIEICPRTFTEINLEGDDGFDYAWSPEGLFDNPDDASPTIYIEEPTLVSVRITDPETGCFADFTKFIDLIDLDFVLDFTFENSCRDTTIMFTNTSQDVNTFNWYVDGELVSSEQDLTFTFPGPGTYEVTLEAPEEDTCNQATRRVNIFPNDGGLFSNNIFICEEEDSITLSPILIDNRLVYAWEPAELFEDPTRPVQRVPTDLSDTYTLTVTDTSLQDCAATDTLQIFLETNAELIEIAVDSNLCIGDSYTLSADISMPDSLVWLDPNGNVLGTDPSITIPIENFGVYTVMAFLGPCELSDSIRLIPRLAEIIPDREGNLCVGDTVALVVENPMGFLIDSVIWSPMDNLNRLQDGKVIFVNPDSTTTYNLDVFYSDGCMVSQTYTVTVTNLAETVTLLADPDSIFFGEESTLILEGLPEGATVVWQPSDFIVSAQDNMAVVRPPMDTTFTAAIDDNGCLAELTVPVTVINVMCERPFVFLPNAFSPNGDGMNDVLFVRGEFIEAIDFAIYDRWGERIFETMDPTMGWDGTFEGELVTPAVYAYSLFVRCIGGDEFSEQGNITVLQ